MPAMQRARAAGKAGKVDEEDVLKRPAPESEAALAAASQTGGTPALPDLDVGPLEPEAWLALQQTLGNRAVGGLVERRKAGQPLPPKTRHDMEASFGRDFGQVHVHSGPEVDQAAQALDAAAFTVGDAIYVHSSVPGGGDLFGREVIGEELAHVAQGIGREGVERVTAPDEPAEREARAAGLAAASGQRASVGAAPAAAGAVARFDLSDVIGAAAAALEAGAGVQTELSDDEKDRLSAGALAPLNALWTKLGEQQILAQGAKPSIKALESIALNGAGIGDFIFSFTGPPGVQPTIDSAAQSALNGRQALLGALDPDKAAKATGRILATVGDEIAGLASAPQPAAAPAPDAPVADALTPAEAEQLKLGVVDPLKSASQQLGEDQPELDLILARIKGVPGVLRSFSKPAALVRQLHAKAMEVQGQVSRLEAIRAGTEGAISMAMGEWQKAINLLQGLTAKSTSGAAPSKAAATAADAGDDDKNKPK